MPPMESDEGFTKFPNSLRDAPWRNKPKTAALYLWLRLNANHFARGWNGIVVSPGEVVTGRKKMSEETGLTEDEVRTALNHLKSAGQITIKTTNKYSVISFTDKENWDDLGEKIPSKIPSTFPNNSPASPQQIPTTRDIETGIQGEKAPRKRFTPPTVEEVDAYCREHGYDIDAQQFVKFYEASDWMRGRTKIKNWKACVVTWVKRQEQTPPLRKEVSRYAAYESN